MITVSQSQALQRWDTLPQELREALYSEKFSAIVWQAGKNTHISEERMGDIAKIVGYVFLGFLHPEDAAEELRDRLRVDQKLAIALAEEFSKKIFGGYRDLLDQIYSPPTAEPQDKAPAIPIFIGGGEPATNRASQIAAETKEAKSKEQRAKNGDIKIPFSKIPVPKPPQKSPAPDVSAPFMLHEEAISKPVEKPSEFRFELKKEFFEKQSAPTAPPPRPPKPATIEIGGGTPEKKKESQIARVGTPAPRIVHYSEVRTPPVMGQESGVTRQTPNAAGKKSDAQEGEKVVNLTDFKIEE